MNNTGEASNGFDTTFPFFARALRPGRLLAAGLIMAGVCLLSPGPCLADTEITVVTLSPDHADLLINGVILRRMHAGQTSPDGVKLISATREQAEVEVDGKHLTLRRGQVIGASVSLEADRQGQYFVAAQINGVPTRAVVDTGAGDVVINMVEAKRMGIDYAHGIRVRMNSANGVGSGWRVTLASVQVGNIVLHNVQGSVVEGGPEKLRFTLIGMTFLSQVDMQRTGSTMVLSKRQ